MKSTLVNVLLAGLSIAANGQLLGDNENELEHECTSWMLFPDVTGGHRFLHKNRDARPRDIIISRWSDPTKFRWIGLGSAGSPNMGLSEKGLAIVMNSGESTFENEPPEEGRMGTPAIARYLLETTATAADAVKEFQKVIETRRYTHMQKGSIFFIMDTKEGYVVECTAHHAIASRVTEGMHVRANIWHNPGMAKYTRNSCKATMNSASREFQATTSLNQALDDHGKVTLEDIRRISRLLGDVEAIGNERGVCFQNTNSVATLEVDSEFPDVLSTAYVTIGPPRHTMFLPVPVCIEDIPADILDASWSNAAFERLDKAGLAFDPAAWEATERQVIAAFADATEKARAELRKGERDNAVEMMRKAFADAVNQSRTIILSTK